MLKNALLILLVFSVISSHAQSTYPTHVEGDYKTKDFTFESGEKLAEMNIHYITVGQTHKDASGNINKGILITHGTTGDSKGLVSIPRFSGNLFSAGQILDATKYFIVHRVIITHRHI